MLFSLNIGMNMPVPILTIFRESYQRCLAIGNLEYAENSMTIDFTLYYISTPLPEITKNLVMI